MLRHLETSCPECPVGRLLMEVEVNAHGSQTFPDGEVVRQIPCDGCHLNVLVTLNGAGSEPTLTPIPVTH